MNKSEQLRNAATTLLETRDQYERELKGEQGGERAPDGYPFEAWGRYSRARMAVQHTLADYDDERECPCGACQEIARKETKCEQS